MRRREFLQRALAASAAAVTSTLFGGGSARAAAPFFSDSFARASTSAGWGKPWFNQRRLRWGIAKRKGFCDVPAPQVGAGRHNPNPVLALDRDVADVDLKAKISTTNPAARFGLLARANAYSDFYAVYLEGDKLRVSRFGLMREDELRVTDLRVKSGASHWIRLVVAGTAPVTVRAKVWRAGTTEPAAWTATATDAAVERIATAGSFGFLFMHDERVASAARFKVASFTATSADRPKKTPPRTTFAFAGRTVPDGANHRARVVAKTDIPAAVAFRYGTDPALGTFTEVAADEVVTKAQVAKGWLEDLPTGATIYWKTVATSRSGRKRDSRIHSFSTPPAPGGAVSFGFASCSHSYLPSDTFAQAAQRGVSFFAHLGDLGYPESVSGGGAAMALTTPSFQDRWTRMLGRKSVDELHRSAAWIMSQDDHDYGRNDCWSETVRPFTIGAFDELSGNLTERFFDLRYGDLHAFFVDTHLHADDPDAPDGPGHSLLGAAQKAWLKDAMRSSNARLLVLFSTMPFWGGGRGELTWKRAFATERQELMGFFFSLQGPGRRVLVCSGNAHAHYVNRHQDPGGGKDVVEFVSSGTDRVDPTPGQLPDDGVIDPQRGVKAVGAFGHVTLEAGGQTRRVVLRCIDKMGAEVWPQLALDL